MLERRFKAVPGVIDVTGWGGKTKTYDIAIDQHKLVGYGLSVPQVLTALGNANINVGGQTVNFGAQAAVVRGVGLIHSADEIRQTLITNNQGAPVVIGDVAHGDHRQSAAPRHRRLRRRRRHRAGHRADAPRRRKRAHHQARRSRSRAHQQERHPAARACSIERIYDRSDLINITTHTVLHNMVAGIALIFLLQWAFLGNLRSAVIVAMTIPFALSFAIGLMVLRGESANLLSVGAIDFGLVVDATVIMVENIFRHLAEASAHLRHRAEPTAHACACRAAFAARWARYRSPPRRSASRSSSPPPSSSPGFVPLFTLSGIEGHIFGPMAKTYAYAIAGGLIATFTDRAGLESDAVSAGRVGAGDAGGARRCGSVYEPALEFVLANRIVALTGIALHRARGRSSRCAPWDSSSCRSSRRATCGSARPFRNRSRWRTATATSIACACS